MRISQGISDSNYADQKTYECPSCKDELGYIVVDDDGNEMWHFCECRSIRRQKKMIKSSNITDEFQLFSFDNFGTEGRPQCVLKAFDIAQFYAQNFENIQSRNSKVIGISLLGVPGSGKTHLLTAVANSLLRSGVEVMYFPWVEGSNELRDSVSKKKDVQEKIDHMKKVRLLYVDDLFKGRKEPTDFQLEWLFEVVNYRYLNRLPMMISSEKYIHQILDFDEAIGRRIYERSREYKVDMILAKGEENMQLNYSIWSQVI